MKPETEIVCSKCEAISGDDWSQCAGSCPMPGSPHYVDPYQELRDAGIEELDIETKIGEGWTLAQIRAKAVEDGFIEECKQCGATPVRDTLDGDPLCQLCCDSWVRGEQPS